MKWTEVLEVTAKMKGFESWEDYMKKHTALFLPNGVNKLAHEIAVCACLTYDHDMKENQDLLSDPKFLRAMADALEGKTETVTIKEMRKRLGLSLLSDSDNKLK